ncbi:hypothetical protein ACIGEP_02370 [Microbacterium sp. NPDC077663]|uniref:hypothetical protein n=1 Tax=Microbacterium sp. NPDC077663 TaxID=3364189 RepID=UPI0037CACB5D
MTQQQTTPKNGLAIATLIVGILAFLTGLIPWVGLLLGLSAFALGVLALTRGQSKPPALIGGSLGAVAAITGLITTIALMAWLIGAPGSV